MKRSNKPIFWSLFGAGGTLSALIGPMLVLITGILVPLSLVLPRSTMTYDRMLAFARNGFGKAALLAVISLFLFHGCHRLYHCHGVSPSQEGERRVVYTMEYVTSQEMGRLQRLFSNLKDAFTYFGIRALLRGRAGARVPSRP